MDWQKELRKRFPHTVHLKSSVVHDEFDSSVGPSLNKLGFERVKDNAWMRSVTDEIDHVVTLSALKGLSHQILIGVRLSFAPGLNSKSLRNHTSTEASSEMLDLVHNPYGESEYNPIQQRIDAKHSYKFLRQDIKKQRKYIIPYLKCYFANANTLEVVLSMYEAERHRNNAGLGFKNYARHMVAYPFLLARLGRLEEAILMIEKRLDKLETTESVRTRALAKLHEVASLAIE
jgi:hypothetical protein